VYNKAFQYTYSLLTTFVLEARLLCVDTIPTREEGVYHLCTFNRKTDNLVPILFRQFCLPRCNEQTKRYVVSFIESIRRRYISLWEIPFIVTN